MKINPVRRHCLFFGCQYPKPSLSDIDYIQYSIQSIWWPDYYKPSLVYRYTYSDNHMIDYFKECENCVPGVFQWILRW